LNSPSKSLKNSLGFLNPSPALYYSTCPAQDAMLSMIKCLALHTPESPCVCVCVRACVRACVCVRAGRQAQLWGCVNKPGGFSKGLLSVSLSVCAGRQASLWGCEQASGLFWRLLALSLSLCAGRQAILCSCEQARWPVSETLDFESVSVRKKAKYHL